MRAPEGLRPLKDSGLFINNPLDDIRWRTVIDSAGHELGRVDELLIDWDQRKVRFLRVISGGFLGLRTFKTLIPVEAVANITPDVVRLNVPDRGVSPPAYDPKLDDAPIYDYFGY